MALENQQVDKLLGIAPPAAEQPATDPRFANALAEEHGVTELMPEVKQDAVTAKLDALFDCVAKAPSEKQTALMLAGVARMYDECRGDGPGMVAHLTDVLFTKAVALVEGKKGEA